MGKGGLRWKRCPGRAGSVLEAEPLPLLAAASGSGSGSGAPTRPMAPLAPPAQWRGVRHHLLHPSASLQEHPAPAEPLRAGASQSAPAPAAHPGRFIEQKPEQMENWGCSTWIDCMARDGVGKGGTGEASGGLQPLRPCCAAPRCRTRHGAQRGTGQGAGVTPWVFITTCHFRGAGQPGQAHNSARSPPQHVPALQPGQHHPGPQHPQHCALSPSCPNRGARGWTLARVSHGASQPSPGLGACSRPWPWLHAHGWVGNHSSYFWFSPWEVLQEGGREHPDLVPEIPKVPSLGWVGHTRSQGTALLGTGRGGMSRTSPLPHPSSLSLSLSWSLAQAAAAPTKPPQQ